MRIRQMATTAFAGLRGALGTAEVVFGLICAAIFVVASELEVMEELIEQMRLHEDWELDELILGLTVVGLCSLIAMIGRGLTLRLERSRREHAEEEVRWLALHDPLTGLANRRYVDELVAQDAADRRRTPDRRGDAQSLARGRDRRASPGMSRPARMAALAIDLDGFKQVNTLVGHDGGDELLRECAARLRRVAQGSVIARLGGDEFLVICDLASEPSPHDLALRISAALSEQMSISGVSAKVGASVGIALIPRDALDLGEAIRKADAALYRAKDDGRDRAVAYQPEMGESLDRRAQLEADLRRAVETGAISLRYQPLVSFADGALLGFEALARWIDADGHVTAPPAEFVPLAEETGQIVALSELLLDRACADAAGWPAPAKLSFNISPVQLSDKALADRILWAVESHGLQAERLQIEVTEYAVMRSPEVAQRVLQELRLAGVQVALDDFGSGYSSLAQLTQLEFDMIKIDQGFVARAGDDGPGDEILRAVLGLAAGLQVAATAEGIETEAQYERLKQLGCDIGQGFLLGKPLTPAEAQALAHAEETRRAALDTAQRAAS